jgi:hypothetical protein
LVRCVYCGDDGLSWEQNPRGKWRLTDDAGIHDCKNILDENGNTLIKCVHCKIERFHWAEDSNGKWRLFNEADELHDCRKEDEEVKEPEPPKDADGFPLTDPSREDHVGIPYVDFQPTCDYCEDYGCPHCNGDYSPEM